LSLNPTVFACLQTLQYFKTAKCVAPVGTIALNEVTEVRAVAQECSSGCAPLDARFELHTHARTFVLGDSAPQLGSASKRADNQEPTKAEWVRKLREVRAERERERVRE
jgi:hypothetical protein